METQIVNLPSAQLRIREASESDLIHMEWDGEYRHFRKLYQEIFQSSQKGDAILWVVEMDGAGIIGQVFIQLNSARKELADGCHRAYLYGFRVHPSFQNQGIGSFVLEFVETDLLNRNFDTICLNVGRDNIDARRLYHRRGYRIAGIETGEWSYLDDNGQRQHVHEPAWRMEKNLKAGRLMTG